MTVETHLYGGVSQDEIKNPTILEAIAYFNGLVSVAETEWKPISNMKSGADSDLKKLLDIKGYTIHVNQQQNSTLPPATRTVFRLPSGWTPLHFWSLFSTVELRALWDERTEKSEIIQQAFDKHHGGLSSLVKTSQKGFMLISGRELVVVSSPLMAMGDGYLTVLRSCDEEQVCKDYPYLANALARDKKRVRANALLSAVYIKPTNTVEGNGQPQYQCMIISHGDPKGSLPFTVAEMQTNNQAISSPLKMIQYGLKYGVPPKCIITSTDMIVGAAMWDPSSQKYEATIQVKYLAHSKMRVVLDPVVYNHDYAFQESVGSLFGGVLITVSSPGLHINRWKKYGIEIEATRLDTFTLKIEPCTETSLNGCSTAQQIGGDECDIQVIY